MNNSLSDAVNTTLTTAANKAVDAAIKETYTEVIQKAVKEQAKELEKAFAAAVDNVVESRMNDLYAVCKKEANIKFTKAVRKVELEAKIEEVRS